MQENVFLRDLGIPGIACDDTRRFEVVATGLPLAGGLPLAIDETMVGVLHGDGTAWQRADQVAGVSIVRAQRDKSTKYPELQDSTVRLTTLACEVGGRWSSECLETVEQLAAARAREAPGYLQTAARRALEARWWALLSCAQQGALAATLVDDAVRLLDGCDVPAPELAEILVDEMRS